MENSTNIKNIDAEGIAMIIAGVSAALVAIIYSFKNVKHSDCGCITCDQQVLEEHLPEAEKPNTISLV